MVYVLNVEGRPLMPTGRHGHVRRMLRDGKARVVRRCPFTIQLMCEGTSYTQPVHLGIDAGSKRIGVSAATEKEVLYEAEVELRNDIKELLSSRREARRARRNRKTRYRKPRFLNRTKAKRKGWLAPSVEQKVQTHLTVIRKACGILPVSKITIETASFDTQMLRAKELGLSLPAGTDYQQGEQLYSWNVREYVLFRDGHTCRCCKGKSKDGVLEVHHIESRKTGGDAPNNLVTLCRTCHEGHHRGTVKLPEDIKRGNRYNDAAFMGIMRWKVYDRLKEEYGPDMVHMTYGYITKRTRIGHGLQKGHRIDARCISGHPDVAPPEEVFFQKKIRCHNRQIHKFGIPKGGVRKRNQAPYLVKGFRLFDKVEYGGQECFIFGRRSSGYFDVRLLDGTKVHAGVSYRKLRFLEPRRTMLIERRTQGTTA